MREEKERENEKDMYKEVSNENLPVKWNYDESKNARSDGHVCYEVVDGAIHHSEGPIRVEEEDKVEGAVEQWHHKIRNGKIYQEVISYGTHSPVSWNKREKRETDKSHVNIFMILPSVNGDVLKLVSNFTVFI